MQNLKTAALLSSISALINKLIALSSVVVIARLLTPEEIGVFVIASAFTLIAAEVRLLGINSYIIREKKIDREKIQKCIAVAMLLCFSIGFILLLLAYPVSLFYKNNDVQILLYLLCVSFFTVPYISSTNAILTKNFLFGKVMMIQNIGPLIGLIVTVLFIYEGLSYFSLALGQVTTTVVSLIVAFFLKPNWVSWKPKFVDLKEIFTVGMYNSGIQLLQKVQTLIPDLVLGKTSSASYTAVFSRAMGFQLFMHDVLLMGIQGFSLSYLSKNSELRNELKKAYLKSTDLVHCLVLPPIVSAIMLAEPLILLMFGDQWLESVYIAQILGIWMILRIIHQMTIPMLISIKKEKILFNTRLVVFCIFIMGIIFGSLISPSYSVYIFVIVGIIDCMVLSYIVRKELEIGISKFFLNSFKAFIVTITCLIVSTLILLYYESTGNIWTTLLIAASILPTTWITLIWLIKHPLSDIVFEFIGKTKKLRVKLNDEKA